MCEMTGEMPFKVHASHSPTLKIMLKSKYSPYFKILDSHCQFDGTDVLQEADKTIKSN